MDDDNINTFLAFGLLGYGAVFDEDGPHFTNFTRDGFYVRNDPPEPFIDADGISWAYRFTGPDGKDYFAPLLNSAQMMKVGQAMVDGLQKGLQERIAPPPEDDDALPLGA